MFVEKDKVQQKTQVSSGNCLLTSFDFEVTGQFERHPRLHGDAGRERWQVFQLFSPQSGGEQNMILNLIIILPGSYLISGYYLPVN